MQRNIKNSFKLLSDIVEGLNKIIDYETRINQILVSFYENEKLIDSFSLLYVLDILAKDVVENKFGNWENANFAKVWI